jgi:proteic killer suppression protein
MDVSFADGDLDRLETDPKFDMGLPEGVVKAYRKRLQIIRSALDERDLYALKSSRFEKLKGKRQHQHSMRLNDQYRLVLELGVSRGAKNVRVVGVEDYH